MVHPHTRGHAAKFTKVDFGTHRGVDVYMRGLAKFAFKDNLGEGIGIWPQVDKASLVLAREVTAEQYRAGEANQRASLEPDHFKSASDAKSRARVYRSTKLYCFTVENARNGLVPVAEDVFRKSPALDEPSARAVTICQNYVFVITAYVADKRLRHQV